MGPMFRYERPQKGRQRQFHQVGVEFFGVAHPAADVEVISLCDELLRRLGFQNIVTKVNTIGCPTCRKAYNERLRQAILDAPEGWCEQCLERARVNPMRVFDCKVAGCGELVKKLPRVNEAVCGECKAHFDQVIALLDAAGIAHEPDDNLVRGFDYYTRTVFEVMQGNIGAQSAILGGGRYDGLVKELGGPEVPAVGMGIGMERLILAMEANGIAFPDSAPVDFYALAMDEESVPAVFDMVHKLRSAGKVVAFDCQPRNMKAGFKAANRVKAREMLIMGSNERERGVAQKKNLETGEQAEVQLSEL
jgi:histidyl-tRNA synthetase